MKSKFDAYYKYLTILIFLVLSLTAFSQKIDFSKIKVDQLTDRQIETILSNASKQGLSNEALYSELQAQGMDVQEVSKFKERLTNLSLQTINKQVAPDGSMTSVNIFDGVSIPINQNNIDDKDIDSRIFGSKLFSKANTVFEPSNNIPTPENYVLGPRDKINLDISGDNEANYVLDVSPDGNIKIQYAGVIKVSGLTIESAKSKITNTLRSVYPGINSGRTYITLTLNNIRTIQVHLTGELVNPGKYALPSTSNVFNALYAAGGPSNLGTYRNIKVIRNNKVIETVDTYDYLLNGIQNGNINLLDNDVIHVPVFNARVELQGQVKREGIYETLAGEVISDIIKYAGGFESDAYSNRIKVLKSTNKEKALQDLDHVNFTTYVPNNGDIFFIEKILDRFSNRVHIEGAVFRIGEYSLDKVKTLRGLIESADGVTEDAFLERAYIFRFKEDNSPELISFNLKKILNGEIHDIDLKREDKVIISSIFDLKEEYNITINGEVRNPGTFKYSENITVGSAILLAGGITELANFQNIEIARRVRNVGAETLSKIAEVQVLNFNSKEEIINSDFVLEPYDIVTIRQSTGYQVQRQVRIEGEVKFPGLYTIQHKNEKISDLIQRAGGFTEYAYLQGASLKRVAKSSEIAVQNGAKSQQDDSVEDELTEDNEQMKQIALTKTKTQGAQTELFFNNNIGIQLEKILKNKDTKDNIFLEDGDILIIPKQLQTVKVVGEILSPISVVYAKGKGLKYYINQAGGFTSKANKSKVFVQYANGSVKGTNKFIGRFYPDVKPGAEIIVPLKPERERLSAQAIVGLSSGVVSMLAIIVSLLK